MSAFTSTVAMPRIGKTLGKPGDAPKPAKPALAVKQAVPAKPAGKVATPPRRPKPGEY